MVEGMDVLKRSIVRGMRNGLFEVALKTEDTYAQVWRREDPPSESDLFFEPHYQLTRLGLIPRPAPQDAHDSNSSVEPMGAPPPQPADPTAASAPKVKRRVQLRFENLNLEQIPQLVDVAGALDDAGGALRINVSIEATNPEGLDETALDLNVREVLSQYGLMADWEES